MNVNTITRRLTTASLTAALLAAFPSAAAAQDNGDLNLSGAISAALEHNYGITISGSRSRIASINNTWGTAGRYPTVSFDAGSSNSLELTDNSSLNRLSAGIGMNWTLFDGFRVQVSKENLDELEKLAGGQEAVVIENTVEDVILGYYFVLLQQESLEVRRKVMDLSEDRYHYELARHELGGSVTYNVLQAQNVYLSDKAGFMNQEVALRTAIRNFNFLLGEEPARQWSFTETFEPDTSAYDLDTLLARMMSDNQILRNQYTNLVLKEQETRLQESELYPNLGLSAGMDWSNSLMVPAAGDPVTNNSLSPYGNLSLTYRIFQGGTRRSAIRMARVNEEIAGVEIREMEHSLTNEMMNATDLYNVRIQLFRLATENLAAAELNLQIAYEKFRSGVIDSFNYRDIQLIYLNAALARLEAIYNLIGTRTELTRLTGGFLHPGVPPGAQ